MYLSIPRSVAGANLNCHWAQEAQESGRSKARISTSQMNKSIKNVNKSWVACVNVQNGKGIWPRHLDSSLQTAPFKGRRIKSISVASMTVQAGYKGPTHPPKKKENIQVPVVHSQSLHADRFHKYLRDKSLDWNYQVLSKNVGGCSSTFL